MSRHSWPFFLIRNWNKTCAFLLHWDKIFFPANNGKSIRKAFVCFSKTHKKIIQVSLYLKWHNLYWWSPWGGQMEGTMWPERWSWFKLVDTFMVVHYDILIFVQFPNFCNNFFKVELIWTYTSLQTSRLWIHARYRTMSTEIVTLTSCVFISSKLNSVPLSNYKGEHNL